MLLAAAMALGTASHAACRGIGGRGGHTPRWWAGRIARDAAVIMDAEVATAQDAGHAEQLRPIALYKGPALSLYMMRRPDPAADIVTEVWNGGNAQPVGRTVFAVLYGRDGDYRPDICAQAAAGDPRVRAILLRLVSPDGARQRKP